MNTYSYVFNDRYIYNVLYCILYSMLKKKLYIGKHLSHSDRNITVERIMMVNFKKRRRKDNIASKRDRTKIGIQEIQDFRQKYLKKTPLYTNGTKVQLLKSIF